MMPFFRLPAAALKDDMIVDKCYLDGDREIFDLRSESLALFRSQVSALADHYREAQSGARDLRQLDFSD
jgi:hypothetical protein